MNLFINTQNYFFSMDGLTMDLVDGYLTENLDVSPNTSKSYSITKKDISKMLEHFQNEVKITQDTNKVKSMNQIIHHMNNTYTFMNKNEKATLKYY